MGFSTRIRNQRGLSVAEALVTAAIIGTLVVLIAQYRVLFPPHQNLIHDRSCQDYAQSILGLVQEETYYRELVNYVPSSPSPIPVPPVTRYATQFDNPAVGSRAIRNPGDWWSLPNSSYVVADKPVPGQESKGTTLQNFQLINGSLRTLAAIFNDDSNAALRCNLAKIYPTILTTVLPPPELANPAKSTAVWMELRPYNIATNVSQCSSPISIAPPEGSPKDPKASAFAPNSANIASPPNAEKYSTASTSQPPSPAFAAGATMANRGVGDASLGIEMSVRVTYTDNGQTQACNVTQKFEYPRDRSPPPKPNVAIVSSNPTNPVRDCQPNTPGDVDISLGYDATNPNAMERGFEFLCHDLSWQRGWPALQTAGVYSSAPCVRSGVVDPTNRPTAPDPNLQNFTGRQKSWVPCDQLTQCGETPVSSIYNNETAPLNTSDKPHMIKLTYRGLPAGCVMNFEVITVDTAGNTSIAGSDANRVFLDTTNPGLDPNDEIQQNTCGAYCSPSMANYADGAGAANFPAGYYTCHGSPSPSCCIGSGCSPNSP